MPRQNLQTHDQRPGRCTSNRGSTTSRTCLLWKNAESDAGKRNISEPTTADNDDTAQHDENMGAPDRDRLDKALEPFEPDELLLPDADLEDQLVNLPTNSDNDDMITHKLEILYVHVPEVCSQPRVTTQRVL